MGRGKSGFFQSEDSTYALIFQQPKTIIFSQIEFFHITSSGIGQVIIIIFRWDVSLPSCFDYIFNGILTKS